MSVERRSRLVSKLGLDDAAELGLCMIQYMQEKKLTIRQMHQKLDSNMSGHITPKEWANELEKLKIPGITKKNNPVTILQLK